MELLEQVRQRNQQNPLWQQSDRLLLAVSGGVDSMALLRLFELLPVKERPFFAVAHVNHQLRAAAQKEETFLAAYCQERGIPFHVYQWQQAAPEAGNLEARARTMRYQFFTELCQTHHYRAVLTGHHGDDQGETFLLKLTRGTQLKDLVGMMPISQRQGVTIIRPLLPYRKEELRAFARTEQLVYFEDETNSSADYARNRLRQQVLPVLKAENANFLQHIHNLVKQIEYANTIIGKNTAQLQAQLLKQVGPEEWEIDLSGFLAQDVSSQYMFLVALLQEALINQGVSVQEEHLEAVLSLWRGERAAGEIHLPDKWLVLKEYQVGRVRRRSTSAASDLPEDLAFELAVGESVFVSPREWFTLLPLEQELNVPSSMSNWEQFDLELPASLVARPLSIRRAEPKARLVIDQAGHHKEIRRLFIDAKIPQAERPFVWMVQGETEILWVVPVRKSYLSIKKETDKIQYKLIYMKARLDSEET